MAYYNSLINHLLLNGLEPFVTLFHWDLPQAFEDSYGGFLNPQIVNDFSDYAELCYKEFGDRVKHWITLNEPLTFTSLGYGNGAFVPGQCSERVSPTCIDGDSSIEPYMVAHHQILAHALAFHLYRDKYQVFQKEQVGIALNSAWTLPLSESEADYEPASHALAFTYDWFMEPLNSGSYLARMVAHVKGRLPKFSTDQSLRVKGSFDFIGLNYYTSNYATTSPNCHQDQDQTYFEDYCALTSRVDEFNNGTIVLDDTMRIDYYNHHISLVKSALRKGVNLKGYFGWSLLDNFEWADGYTVRFGFVFVDYNDGLKRYLKNSAQ